MNKDDLLRIVLLLCMTPLLSSAAQTEDSPPAGVSPSGVNTPQAGIEVDATLQWARRVELSTPVSGVVVEVLAQTGQHVSKDEVMLRLDSRVREANREQYKAQLIRHTRLRNEAQRELDRAQELFNATLLSEHDMELARIGFDSAQAEFQHANAALVQAESDLKYSEVRAPFDGVVVQRLVETGQTVVTQLQATPLFVVAQAEVMIARSAVTLAKLHALKAEQTLTVKAGGRRYLGHVTQLGLEPLPKREESKYALEVTFATQGVALRAGEAAKIVLP